MDDSRGSLEICGVARQCKAVFAECVANPSLGHQAWIRAAQGDFNLWCASINATSAGKSSLDYRLRTRPDVRDAVRGLVRALVEALKKCQQLVVEESKLDDGLATIREEFQSDPGDPDPDSPQSYVSWEAISNKSSGPASSSGDETLDPILSEQISYAKTILSQLQRISLAIRKSGNKYRFEKADAALDGNIFEEFRKHLTTIILIAFEDTEAKELTAVQKMQRASDYDRLTPIQRRMVRANILRRNRIEFVTGSPTRKSRPTSVVGRPEPAVDAGMPAAVEPATVDTDPAPSQPTPSITITPPRQTTPGESTRSVAHTTLVTATDVGSKLDIKHILTRPASSTVTKMTRIGSSQAFPGCPNPGSDGAVLCPYCNDVLPLEYSRSKHKDSWKAHVVQDIIPYSCVIEGCDTPDEMYLTANTLLAHTLELHSTTRWTCDYCAFGVKEGKDSTVEEQQLFDNAEEWESHISLAHGDEIPADQRGILAELNKRRVIGPLSCPLCEFSTGSMDTKIDDHILQHLHEFALRALPEGARETDDPGSKTSQASRLLSHTQSNSIDAIIAREYPVVTIQEVEDAMDRAWHLVSTSGTKFLQPGLKRPLHSDAAATELWQTKSRRLKEILDTLKFISQDSMWWRDPDIQDLAVEAVEAVEEMNSAAVAKAQRLPINQTDSVQDISVPSPPSHFTGRENILEKLDYLLFFCNQDSNQQSRIALIGPKGMGKTSIARIFVHRMREQSKDCSVFWVDASTENSIEQSYNAIAGEFGDFPEWPGSILNRVQLFLRHLTWTFNGHWLVVMDGLQRQTALYLSFENLIPQGLRGSLLLTASDPTCLALLGPVEIIQVPELDDETSIQHVIQRENDNCLKDLRLSDPRDDKTRIEWTKGGLLKDLYHWILDNPDFRQWRDNHQSRLLWIKGGPGKGKTMLLCGIIDELNKSTVHPALLSYFFCQCTDSRNNNATAVLRGLIYMLVNQQPSLISHVRKRYDHAGKGLFEDVNAWVALSEIFANILEDPDLKSTFLIIDALDECVTDLPQLLDLIVEKSAGSPRVKWVVSSRNLPNIEEHLEAARQKVRLCLELNEKSISAAVSMYISLKALPKIEGFQKFILQTGTALHNTDNTFDFAIADWNGDGRPDLVAIKKSKTGTNSTEVHILSGSSNFRNFILQTGTALHETDSTFDFAMADWNGDGRPDLVAIKKSKTGTNSTEVHILSGSSVFRNFILQTGTALHETDSTFDFAMADWNGDGRPDLVAIKKSNTGTNSTEVHILSGSSNFRNFILQTGTALHETDSTFDFAMADWNGDGRPDLVAIKKSNTGTNSTEVHILSGSSNFRNFILQTGTALHETDSTFDFAMADWNGDGRPDLVAIKKSNTGTNSTEVHTLAG
ncbi:hypothetical protein B0T10DRAFT_281052 [Thelonectria olida]|uniref:NACHT domain-containing protein n=1 Tax=Thelonectria olida TaxID=1576542 RepID=A0A9P8VRG4_9HYPO|nr:hypothetical protein B0T10DRAFT_281052 [Thelonectria olida]